MSIYSEPLQKLTYLATKLLITMATKVPIKIW